ncbi:alanine racemase [Candidatus Kapabacteria bacterium]|nr:alanine racemase [Candidatus Kapabacteria bacterium]
MRDSQILISKSNVIDNYNIIKKHANNMEIAPVIKANAYGHGANLLSGIYQELNCRMVIVAYLEEAIEIRNSGYTNDIMLLTPPLNYDIKDIINCNLETTIAEEETAFLLNEHAKALNKTVKVHIFLNSGMNREGKRPEDILKFTKYLSTLKYLKIEGLISHFAASDVVDNMFNTYQINQFKKSLFLLKSNGFNIPKIHIHNSSSLFNYPDSEEQTVFNLYRAGITSYGLLSNSTLAESVGLKPVLTLKSNVHHMIEIRKGETCGYNFNFHANSDGYLAIIPIGYADGLSRNLSNKMRVIINDKYYKVAGYISMDLIIIDVGVDPVKLGDEVIFIGKSNSKEITVYELAEYQGTIPYEITTSLSHRLPRILV